MIEILSQEFRIKCEHICRLLNEVILFDVKKSNQYGRTVCGLNKLGRVIASGPERIAKYLPNRRVMQKELSSLLLF